MNVVVLQGWSVAAPEVRELADGSTLALLEVCTESAAAGDGAGGVAGGGRDRCRRPEPRWWSRGTSAAGSSGPGAARRAGRRWWRTRWCRCGARARARRAVDERVRMLERLDAQGCR